MFFDYCRRAWSAASPLIQYTHQVQCNSMCTNVLHVSIGVHISVATRSTHASLQHYQ